MQAVHTGIQKALRILAAAILGLGLTGSVVMANDATIDTTGPDSKNTVEFDSDFDLDVDNHNNVNGAVNTSQTAATGDAKVNHNTTGEDATTGSAENENETAAEVEIDNSGAWDGLCGDCFGLGGGDFSAEIHLTGPKSNNSIEYDNDVDVDVDNHNNINLNVNTTQTAVSGDAEVSCNTTGGGATSGDASNSNSSSLVVSVTN